MGNQSSPATRRAVLSMIGATALTTGCLQRDRSGSTNSTNTTGSDQPSSKPDSEPETEPDSETDNEPQLRLDEDSRDLCRNAGKEWRTCEALDEWEVLAGSLEPSTDRVYSGSQAAHLSANGDENAMVRIPINGLDLANTTFSFAAYVETPGDHYTPLFNVNAPSLGHRLDFRTRYKIDAPGWLRYDLGINNLANLESDEEAYLTISWPGEGVDWYIDDIRAVPITEDPRVIIQFDDSVRSTYETAYPIMQEYDIPATVFTITDRIGDSNSLTLDQMNEMQAADWEFGSHSASHPYLAQLSLKEQRAELKQSKQWLLDYGFVQGADLFAYPFGSFTTDTVDIVADYYHLGTHGQRGVINRTVTAPLSVNRHPGDDAERSMDLLDLLVDESVPCDTLVLYYHEVVENHETWIDPESFRKTMAYIDRNNISTMLTSALWNYQTTHI